MQCKLGVLTAEFECRDGTSASICTEMTTYLARLPRQTALVMNVLRGADST